VPAATDDPNPPVQNHCAAGEIPTTGAAVVAAIPPGIVPAAGVCVLPYAKAGKYGQLTVLDPPFTQLNAFTATGQFLSS
jgi:hypothetical protein